MACRQQQIRYKTSIDNARRQASLLSKLEEKNVIIYKINQDGHEVFEVETIQMWNEKGNPGEGVEFCPYRKERK